MVDPEPLGRRKRHARGPDPSELAAHVDDLDGAAMALLVVDTGWRAPGPGAAETRVLVFAAGTTVVLVEATDRDGWFTLSGVIRPTPANGAAHVRNRRGASDLVHVARSGRFDMTVQPGPFSVVLEERAGARIATAWVAL